MRQRYLYLCANVETGITDEVLLFFDELKALIIINETEEYLPIKKVEHRKLRDGTTKVKVMRKHIEVDDITQTNKFAMTAALCFAK